MTSDACSPGEVGAVRCPVAGRARKGAGRRRPDTPQYDSSITPDPSRALHARPWDGSALGRVGDPRAGRVSEGRIRGTRSPGARTAPVVTAAASNGKPSGPGLSTPSKDPGARGRSHLSPSPEDDGGRAQRPGKGRQSYPGPNSPPVGAGRSVDAGTLCPTPGLGQVWERPHTESRPVPRGGAQDHPCEAQQTPSGTRQPAIHGLVRGSRDRLGRTARPLLGHADCPMRS